MAAKAKGPTVLASVPSVDSRAAQALLVVLSIVAGCTDIIGFLGLNGLFTAHITGNLAVLAAHIVGGEAQYAQVLSIPVFAVMVGLTSLLAGGLQSIGLASLRPLLLLQFLLLAGFLGVCVAAGPGGDPNATNEILAGMLGVAAMAVQNALVQISLNGAPSTAIMTTNVTRFATDVGKVLLGGDPTDVANARNRAARTLPVIIGFAVGCGIGAACEAVFGLRSLALPAGLALLAFAMGSAVEPDSGARRDGLGNISPSGIQRVDY
jgi:uncharacterized membrane protein YoaK (UPF0700 family)